MTLLEGFIRSIQSTLSMMITSINSSLVFSRAFDLCPQTKKHLLRLVDKIYVSFQVIVISMFLPSSIRPLPQHVSSLLCEHNLLSPLPVCEHNSLDVFVLSFFAFLRAGLNFSPSRLLLKPVLYTNVIIAGSLFPSSCN